MRKGDEDLGRIRRVHPHAWLWEPLESDPGFVLGAMFGTKIAYLDGKLALGFAAKEEPWRGILVCTERSHHESLIAAFPPLVQHPILGKWLYLSEDADAFEAVGTQLVELARRRDPRIGVAAGAKRRRKT
jgi:hypothetical protein